MYSDSDKTLDSFKGTKVEMLQQCNYLNVRRVGGQDHSGRACCLSIPLSLVLIGPPPGETYEHLLLFVVGLVTLALTMGRVGVGSLLIITVHSLPFNFHAFSKCAVQVKRAIGIYSTIRLRDLTQSLH